jgi:hypothetical protein
VVFLICFETKNHQGLGLVPDGEHSVLKGTQRYSTTPAGGTATLLN